MPVAVLNPNNTFSDNGWASSSTTTVLADVSDGSDATYAYADNFGRTFVMDFQDLPSSAAKVVSFFSGYRIQATAGWGGTIRQFVQLNAGETDSADRGPSVGSVTEYDDYLARPTGGSYTVADINVMRGGCFAQNGAGGAEHGDVARIYWGVGYENQPGGYSFLVSSLAGAALGLAEMSELVRAIYRKTRVLITPDEYLEAWRDIREHRHPSFFVLGAR